MTTTRTIRSTPAFLLSTPLPRRAACITPALASRSRPRMAVSPISIGPVSAPLGVEVQKLADVAVSEKGFFSVAISGGSLPKLLAAGLPVGLDVTPWRVFLADERIVPLDHPDSNYQEIRTRLSDLSPIPINPTLAPAQCAADYAHKISEALAGQPFDLVLLGLGPDGHTCSLFPGHPLLAETQLSVAPITDSPKPPPERITLTLPELARARATFFVVTGAGKAPVVKDIIENTESKLPGALVRPTQPARWFLDEAAAGDLSPAGTSS